MNHIELQQRGAGSSCFSWVSRKPSKRVMFDLASLVTQHVPAGQRSRGREFEPEEITFAAYLGQKS